VNLVALRGTRTSDDPSNEASLVRDAVHDWRPRFPDVAVTEKVVPTAATHALLLASHDAQLVVVGAHGSGGFAGLALGSTSETILHHGLSSVMVVR
jgi:nucleotide-binding universal stress UspA family protein